jgi:hypothetical protein
MTAHWGIPDPAAVEGTEVEKRLAFADALRMLTTRINVLVALPLRSLSALTLQKQLNEIGKLKASNDNPVSTPS